MREREAREKERVFDVKKEKMLILFLFIFTWSDAACRSVSLLRSFPISLLQGIETSKGEAKRRRRSEPARGKLGQRGRNNSDQKKKVEVF